MNEETPKSVSDISPNSVKAFTKQPISWHGAIVINDSILYGNIQLFFFFDNRGANRERETDLPHIFRINNETSGNDYPGTVTRGEWQCQRSVESQLPTAVSKEGVQTYTDIPRNDIL